MTNLPSLVLLSVATSGVGVQLRVAYPNITEDPLLAMQSSTLLSSFKKYLESEEDVLKFLTGKSLHFLNNSINMYNMLLDMATQSALISVSEANLLRQGLNAADKIKAAAALSLMSQDASNEGGSDAYDDPRDDVYDPTNKCSKKDSFGRLGNALGVSQLEFANQVVDEYQTNNIKSRLSKLSSKGVDAINPVEDPVIASSANGFVLLVKLFTLVLAGGNANRTAWFLEDAEANCWQPNWITFGPMIFKWDLVAARLADPKQLRGYFTMSVPQTEKYFRKSLVLFQDGKKHRDLRLLSQQVDYAASYPLNLDRVRRINPLCKNGCEDLPGIVGFVLIPVMMEALLGAAPPEDIVFPYFENYRQYGKYSIFGAMIDGLASSLPMEGWGFSAKITAAREAITKWALGTPFAKKSRVIYDKSSYRYTDFETVFGDMVDASIFAGYGGTVEMTEKCLVYQLRDSAHKRMFEANPEMYLLELMRYDSAVTSATEKLPAKKAFVMNGSPVTLAKGTPTQLIMATANRDPLRFSEPHVFNPERKDAKYNLAWNGQLDHVEARDLTKAPRHCPGQCLSVKVASNVCARLLGNWEKLFKEGKLNNELHCKHFS